MNRIVRNAATAFAALATLAGCTQLPPIQTTFDTLTNETSMRSTDYFAFSTFVSLNGMVPQQGVQMMSHQPDFDDQLPNSPSYAIGISPTRSFVTERRYPMSRGDGRAASDLPKDLAANSQAVMAIRDDLNIAQALAAKLAAIAVQIDIANSIRGAVNGGAADDLQAQTLQALLGSDILGADKKIDDTKFKDGIRALNVERTTVEKDIKAALDSAKTAAKKRNVVITRWARERRTSVGAFLSDIFAISGQGYEAKSGLLIMGDIRATTLHTGDDFVDMLRSSPDHMLSFVNMAGITTFNVQARHLAFSADLDLQQSVAGRLSLTQTQLADLSKTFRDLNVNSSGSFGVAMDVSNTATLSDSIAHVEGRCFFPPALYTKSVKREIAASDGFQTVFAVRAKVRGQLKDTAKNIKTGLSEIAESCTSNGTFDLKKPGCDARLHTWLAACETGREPPAEIKAIATSKDKMTDAQAVFGGVPYPVSSSASEGGK